MHLQPGRRSELYGRRSGLYDGPGDGLYEHGGAVPFGTTAAASTPTKVADSTPVLEEDSTTDHAPAPTCPAHLPSIFSSPSFGLAALRPRLTNWRRHAG